MMRYAERTGLTSARPERRYLWTDAFAVCNFLGLARSLGAAGRTELALRLVDRVHHVLGKHRPDDRRTGWIGGGAAAEGEAHPTRGGLRIGKELPERRPDQPFDERLEWERDGQYFHYLTQWMHALSEVTRSTGLPQFTAWARELAEAARRAFVHSGPGGRRRIFWKMSTDLSRPLVSSMGQHDALDGYVVCAELELADAAAEFAAMIRPDELATADPLGLGGLLVDAVRLHRLALEPRLLESLLQAAQLGVARCAQGGELGLGAEQRLAFRELGLAIGLEALPLLPETARAPLVPHAGMAAEIVAFWLDAEHQQSSTFVEHQDINEVMLATALAPNGFLGWP